MMVRCYFFILYFILFMHACKCNARPILNIHQEMFPPHEIQERKELSRNSKDSDNSKAKEEEDILHKKNEGTRNNSGSTDEEWESNWLHSAMMNTTKLEGERMPLPQLKGRGKLLNSSIFGDQNLIATDYEPPHRKSPIHN